MTSDRVVALAASGESETLEFKETTGTRREADHDGVCLSEPRRRAGAVRRETRPELSTGQQVSERTIEELSAELRQIDPPAFPTVERVPVDGGREVIVVGTGQGASRPY